MKGILGVRCPGTQGTQRKGVWRKSREHEDDRVCGGGVVVKASGVIQRCQGLVEACRTRRSDWVVWKTSVWGAWRRLGRAEASLRDMVGLCSQE